MNLKCFLLGLIAAKPSSGYTLHKKIFAPWRPAISQVYRTLNEMEQDKLVTSKKVITEKLPYQNIFQITDAGLTVLRRWLNQPQKERLTRHRVLEQMWFGNHTDREHIINDIKTFADHAREQLEYYQNDAKPRIEKHAKTINDPLNKMYHELASEYAMRECKLVSDWAKSSIERILNFESEDITRKGSAKRKKTDTIV